MVDEMNETCQSDNNSYPLNSKARRLNAALDRFVVLAMKARNWIYDDSNNANLPIGRTNIIAGQVDYPFATEHLVIEKIFLKDSNGNYDEIFPEEGNEATLSNSGNGTARRYRFVGSSILLDHTPEHDVEDGIKVLFRRITRRISSADTTQSPGIPSTFHPWLCHYASLPYLVQFSKAQKGDVAAFVKDGEESILFFMANRNNTSKRRLSVRQEDNR